MFYSVYKLLRAHNYSLLDAALPYFIPSHNDRKTLLNYVFSCSYEYRKAHNNIYIPFDKRLLLLYYALQCLFYKPVPYIMGYVYWADMKIMVDKNTLIPRMETEELCLWIVNKERFQRVNTILDIGTGSGIISMYMKKTYPNSTVYAIDSSKKALSIATKNAHNNALDIVLSHTNFMDYTPSERINIIIANLPYIPDGYQHMGNGTCYEPKSALYSGKDGLSDYRNLCKWLMNIDFDECWIEFLGEQYDDLCSIYKAYKLSVYTDIAGTKRFLCIQNRTTTASLASSYASQDSLSVPSYDS